MKITLPAAIKPDELTLANRLYPRAVLEAAVAQCQPDIKARRLLGEFFHMDEFSDTKVHLVRVSHLVTDLRLVESNLIIEIDIFDNERGLELIKQIESGQVVAFPRGYGDVVHDDVKSIDVVQPGLTFIAIDAADRRCTLTKEELDELCGR